MFKTLFIGLLEWCRVEESGGGTCVVGVNGQSVASRVLVTSNVWRVACLLWLYPASQPKPHEEMKQGIFNFSLLAFY